MWQVLLLMGLFGFQQGDIKEKQRVDFVLVDVVAIQGKDQLVTDLKASDFEVRENRKKVDVTFFDILDYRQAFEMGLIEDTIEMPQLTDKAESEKPLQQVAIVLDLEMYHIEEILGAFDHLTRLLDGLDPKYRYQIMVYSLDKGMLTEGFVEDIPGARHAIEKYRARFRGYREKNPTWDQDDPLAGGTPTDRPNHWIEQGVIHNKDGVRKRHGNLRYYDREFNAITFEYRLQECLRNFYKGAGNSPCECLDNVLDDFLNMIAMRTEGVVERLIDLTFKFNDASELKSMYFVSPGFVLEDVTAVYDLHRKHQIRSQCGKPNTTVRTGTHLDRSRDEMPTRKKLDLRVDFRQVLHACVANRVMFNTVHFYKGNYVGDMQSEFIKRNGQGLLELAEKSGGKFHQTGDLKTVIERDLQQNRYFYVLGYESKKGRKGSYRRISVKCKRRGVKLRYRDGYYRY